MHIKLFNAVQELHPAIVGSLHGKIVESYPSALGRTGHRTAGIVMKHYFQPGREDFRRTLAGKMPALLVGGTPKVEPFSLAEVRAKLEGMESKNWSQVRDELLARLSPESGKIISAKGVQIEVLTSVA